MRRWLFVVGLLVGLTGCPGGGPEDSSQNAPAKTTTTTQSPQAVPENTTAMNPVAPHSPTEPSASPTVDVHLIEYAINMSDTLTAGRHTFKVANGGKEQHSLVVEGPEGFQKLGTNLSGGSTGELAVMLQPGTYVVWCPVDEHRGKGMQKTITVK